jgi:hypothetical protein
MNSNKTLNQNKTDIQTDRKILVSTKKLMEKRENEILRWTGTCTGLLGSARTVV